MWASILYARFSHPSILLHSLFTNGKRISTFQNCFQLFHYIVGPNAETWPPKMRFTNVPKIMNLYFYSTQPKDFSILSKHSQNEIIWHDYKSIPIFFLQEFHWDMYFRQFWNDERLSFENKGAPAKVDKLASAVLKTKVWVPDPFFANQKEGHVLDNPADNTLFRISRNGNFYLVI